MVAVVSGKGGTSSRLCSAPNFSTSENLGHERESAEIGFRDEKGKVLKLLMGQERESAEIVFGTRKGKFCMKLIKDEIISLSHLTTLIPSESASSTKRGFTSLTVTITFRQAGAELRMLRKFD